MRAQYQRHLSDHGSVDIHDDDLAVCRAEEHEFVVRSPDAARDVSEFQIEHRRPVALTSNGTDQHETIPAVVTNDSVGFCTITHEIHDITRVRAVDPEWEGEEVLCYMYSFRQTTFKKYL